MKVSMTWGSFNAVSGIKTGSSYEVWSECSFLYTRCTEHSAVCRGTGDFKRMDAFHSIRMSMRVVSFLINAFPVMKLGKPFGL